LRTNGWGGGGGGARRRICRAQYTRSYCKKKEKKSFALLIESLLYASGNIFHSKANDIVQDVNFALSTLIKKENQIFLEYKEIQNGAVAKSYMTNGLLIYGEIFAHFLIY
jgi:hypothetical protein